MPELLLLSRREVTALLPPLVEQIALAESTYRTLARRSGGAASQAGHPPAEERVHPRHARVSRRRGCRRPEMGVGVPGEPGARSSVHLGSDRRQRRGHGPAPWLFWTRPRSRQPGRPPRAASAFVVSHPRPGRPWDFSAAASRAVITHVSWVPCSRRRGSEAWDPVPEQVGMLEGRVDGAADPRAAMRGWRS